MSKSSTMSAKWWFRRFGVLAVLSLAITILSAWGVAVWQSQDQPASSRLNEDWSGLWTNRTLPPDDVAAVNALLQHDDGVHLRLIFEWSRSEWEESRAYPSRDTSVTFHPEGYLVRCGVPLRCFESTSRTTERTSLDLRQGWWESGDHRGAIVIPWFKNGKRVLPCGVMWAPFLKNIGFWFVFLTVLWSVWRFFRWALDWRQVKPNSSDAAGAGVRGRGGAGAAG